jgi:hypothetical protein
VIASPSERLRRAHNTETNEKSGMTQWHRSTDSEGSDSVPNMRVRGDIVSILRVSHFLCATVKNVGKKE